MATSRTGTAKWKNLRARTLVLARSNGLTNCPLCRCVLDYNVGRTPTSAEVDHVVPYARGGGDTADNVQVICRRLSLQPEQGRSRCARACGRHDWNAGVARLVKKHTGRQSLPSPSLAPRA